MSPRDGAEEIRKIVAAAPDVAAAKEADQPEHAAAAESAIALAWMRQQIDAARPISGTPAEQYLVKHRGLRPPWPSSLLWSETFHTTPHAPPRPAGNLRIQDHLSTA